MDYYKRYMGDYQRDTGDLSLAQHGAFTVLLDHYYSVRKPLPAAMEKLHRLCRATTKAEQDAVESVVDEFFKLGPDGLRHNARADEEIAKWEEFAQENREKGKLGGRPKKNPSGNPSGNPPGNPTGSGGGQVETQRVSNGLGKGAVSETRTKPYPDPNPNPRPILSHSLTQSARAGEALRGDDFEQLQLAKGAYPIGTFDETDWLEAQRSIAQWVDTRSYTWDQVIGGIKRYAAQQAAKGNLDTQFVKSPKAFFAFHPTNLPRFLEQFPLPAAGNGKPAWTPPKSIEEIEAEERARDQH
jgi:uncharacterized protein YdaU (DUF1376 family)